MHIRAQASYWPHTAMMGETAFSVFVSLKYFSYSLDTVFKEPAVQIPDIAYSNFVFIFHSFGKNS